MTRPTTTDFLLGDWEIEASIDDHGRLTITINNDGDSGFVVNTDLESEKSDIVISVSSQTIDYHVERERLLGIKRAFTPVPDPAFPAPHKYERFTFWHHQWDVAHAWSLISKDEETSGHINVKEAYDVWLADNDREPEVDENGRRVLTFKLTSISIDKEKAMSDAVNLDVPLLMVRIVGDTPDEVTNLIIDGWHRIYKAYHTGTETLPLYLLDGNREIACRVL